MRTGIQRCTYKNTATVNGTAKIVSKNKENWGEWEICMCEHINNHMENNIHKRKPEMQRMA